LETYEQAYRRVYRQGVKGGQVRIHRILSSGTVDEVMAERLEGKHATQQEFLEALKKHARG
jgi:SNF2 family DNA or RNA helicase